MHEFTVAVALQKSIALLLFFDLTEGMKEGEFADGIWHLGK